MDIHALREDYKQGELRRKDLHDDPFKQFEKWFQQACNAELLEPNAMTLSTVSEQGQPFMRTVLLKYFDSNGLVFFTNYESRKAQQIGVNPNVSILFTWLPLQRQVHITGTAEKVSTTESLQYFTSRPRGSQLGAWSSQQSSVISSRQLLLMQFEQIKQKFLDGEIPLPDFWGGYRVVPTSFEFWQGCTNRLHDRFLYTPQEDQSWQIQRLAP
ncbi:pyridoxamine 5'-phosphate oxidase [Phormidium tenue]|jgi:pyridoxamine 5'-phosphate oxidase|uniref:Pyridoxine/pyridoxamine 5'-phosphate oxidase n=1 Tax=Phormidium tenue FACHB-1050 TaxID=2692857 RepID=A0ABR8CEE3_9CYAN|nr:pyridoxamine 5'-phosphate oxidase [Phormidium tenue]MBD2319148.1 pyridoxamine 5'-phosphate oxidase [Phormidium tenue FACHB-1050]